MHTPIKHHYLPVFYMNRWAKCGKISRITREYDNKIAIKQIHPSGCCYKNNLYSFDSESFPNKEFFESIFWSKIDNGAASALKKIESGADITELTDKEIDFWIMFLLGSRIRSPQEIAYLKENYTIFASEFYGKKQKKELNSLLSRPQVEINDIALTTLTNLIYPIQSATKFKEMKWSTIETEDELITGDQFMHLQPIELPTNALCPIGPKKLFIIIDKKENLRLIESKISRRHILKINTLTSRKSSNALIYLGGKSEAKEKDYKSFANKNFGKDSRIIIKETMDAILSEKKR